MKALVSTFFSQLHRECLKPRGYTKARHTFSREMGAYTERIQFQGSAWNDQNSPWIFYINFGVEFNELPPRQPCRDFPATHCWTRIEGLVISAAKEFSLIFPVSDAFMGEIVRLIEQGSEHVAGNIELIRQSYLAKKSPFFPTPRE